MKFARFDDESPDYEKLRDEIQTAEIALRDQSEAVAALRRKLPRNQRVEDLVFEELRDGKHRPLRLSELFKDPEKPLVLMQFMFGKKQKDPCPMCSMWADGYNGAMAHITQRANFAVLVAGDLERLADLARTRGWDALRFVSAADSGLKVALGFETPDGGQIPGVSVFERHGDGSLTHFYSQSAGLGESGGRGMDLLSPVWNYFDLLPTGRGEFIPSLTYGGI